MQMFKRHDIKARIVRQMTCWNVNLIAGFNASEGALSMRYKRYEFYIGLSAKWWRCIKKNSEVGNDFSPYTRIVEF